MAEDSKYLIEVFLPLADNNGNAFPSSEYEAVEQALTKKFGGFTGYPRSPASGKWRKSASEEQEDELIVYEVMTASIDAGWWRDYRESLEKSFRQERILIRASDIQVL